MKRLLSVLVLATSLSACISFLPEPETPDGLYRLGAVSAAETISVPDTVLVRRPEASRHLAGADIIAENESGVLTVIRDATWADNLPRLLQMTLLDYVNSDGEGAALLPQTGTRPAYELVWRISNFQVRGEQAVVQGELTLLNGTTREPVSQVTLESTRTVAGKRTAQRVAALSEAGKDFARQSADFVAETMRASARGGA